MSKYGAAVQIRADKRLEAKSPRPATYNSVKHDELLVQVSEDQDVGFIIRN